MKSGFIGVIIALVIGLIIGAAAGVASDSWLEGNCRSDCQLDVVNRKQLCEQIPETPEHISDRNSCLLDALIFKSECSLGCRGWF